MNGFKKIWKAYVVDLTVGCKKHWKIYLLALVASTAVGCLLDWLTGGEIRVIHWLVQGVLIVVVVAVLNKYEERRKRKKITTSGNNRR